MAAPKGNKNALGNKGGGRKSAYQELANAQTLYQMFFKRHTRAELQKMLAEGNYSLMEVLLSKAYAGDIKALLAIFNKVFPDKVMADNASSLELPFSMLD